MEFDKSRVYTALNADELKVDSKVIVADDLSSLKTRVIEKDWVFTLKKIWGTSSKDRFEVLTGGRFNLCYLVSEPEEKELKEEKKLKWTDLKIGDIICRDGLSCMITCVCNNDTTNFHVCFNGNWHNDYELEDWEKVE